MPALDTDDDRAVGGHEFPQRANGPGVIFDMFEHVVHHDELRRRAVLANSSNVQLNNSTPGGGCQSRANTSASGSQPQS